MSGYGAVTRGTPLGCFVGVLSLLPLIFACIGIYGLIKVPGLPDSDKKQELFEMASRATIGGLAGFLIVAGIACWIYKRTDWKSYNPDDPKIQM